jgi:CTP:molybdopterin cytidylyltransferase MocA
MIAGVLLADSDTVVEGTAIAVLPWDEGEPLVAWQIAQMQRAGVEVVEVVLGANAEDVIPLVSADDVEPIVNDRWAEGEVASLRVGATATPRNTTTAVLVRITQPRSAEVIEAVLQEHLDAKARVTRPFSGDVPGWPVCIDADVLARVRNLPDGTDVEEVLREYDTLVVRIAGELRDLAG